jgi:tetratricopeptide (TPR) repeat protein
MAKKRHTRQSAPIAARPPAQLLKGLAEADELMRRNKPAEARTVLNSLDRRFPNSPDILGMLVNANYDLHDLLAYQNVCERLIRLIPDDPDVGLGLAGAYLMNAQPVLALRAFQRFVERFPDHPRVGKARKTIADLEDAVAKLLPDIGLSAADGLEVAELHERVQSALNQEDFGQLRRLVAQILELKADFTPALNNLSQSYMVEGRLDQAIQTSRRVLEFDPGNIHALANLVVYHCRLGQLDEARQWADRLLESNQLAAERSMKIAEALSYLGDDERVLEVFNSAERGQPLSDASDALLYHLAAVAELRLGHEQAARSHWQQALKLNPGLDVARANVDDFKKPIGERHAPWPFAFGNWTTQRTIEQLSTQVGAKKTDQALTNAVRRFLQQHPEIAAIVPILFDRGDPQARQFALMIARAAGTPEMLVALHDFATSQRGPDKLRHEAGMPVDEAGMFLDRRARFWSKGQWTEVQYLNFEITTEPERPFAPKVNELLRRATELLHERKAERAEELLRQALEMAPDTPALLNNLAIARELQGHRKEAEQITREIHVRHPDYFFARIAVARLHIRDREYDAAEGLLKPLINRRKLHHSEATALFNTYVELYEAQANREAARTWLDIWANIDPENPEVLRRQLRSAVGDRFSKLLGRRR